MVEAKRLERQRKFFDRLVEQAERKQEQAERKFQMRRLAGRFLYGE